MGTVTHCIAVMIIKPITEVTKIIVIVIIVSILILNVLNQMCEWNYQIQHYSYNYPHQNLTTNIAIITVKDL